MILDNEMKVCDSVTVRASDPDYSSSIDLTLSPDMGTGKELYAIIIVELYTAGSSTATEISVVSSAAAALTSPKKLSSVTLTAAQLEARDDGANKQAIVLRIHPNQEADTPVSGVTERYLGIEFDHATTPTVMTVTAYFTHDYQSDPTLAHHASGFIIA